MNESQKKHDIWIDIPAVYNAGECRFSKQIIGPRGGKRWVRISSGVAATGGLQQIFATPGLYKRTTWSNNWPAKSEFEVTENGEVIWLD